MKRDDYLFQDVIMRLQQFWADEGCLIWQPYNVQVGAGTMNPATVLRVLGPEPWRVAYVEPSVRPADGRYAENPNRWQQYYQYQVILKPDPGDPLEMYLRSLEAIGVDLSCHDVRFVEDNWEAPALGAWGLGWEVWCDGQEISQFTYMQQSGSVACDPVSVEITYGLERIVMFLQDAKTFLDIAWEDDITYGDLLYRQEVEHCTYNFEVADIDRLTEMYRIYEDEARACLARGLVIPAHDYVLKCSHAFNVLDARGAVGVTERASFFARMRDLAHKVALAYLKQREEAGFPLSKKTAWLLPRESPVLTEKQAGAAEASMLIFEIGTEELPHDDLSFALEQLKERLPAALKQARLDFGSCRVEGTPRRLVATVLGLSSRQEDEMRVVKGPPAKVAFDAEGKPTKAAEGFAKRNNLAAEDLETEDMDGGEYVVARVVEEGAPALDVLAQLLPELVASLRFNMSMRWNGTGVEFSRPIRWFLALLGRAVVPFEYAGISSGRRTRVLRDTAGDWAEVAESSKYQDVMVGAGIVLSPEERRNLIWEKARKLAASVGGEVREDEALLAEVADLVEAPRPILGGFSEEFLSLPAEVLITVMKKHQRYFAVEKNGKLMPYFIAVRNGGTEGDDIVRAGNEAVLRARFADAVYFYRQDLNKPLDEFLLRLETLTFQARLGSMLDKARRLEALAPELATALDVPVEDLPLVARASRFAKADLASQMVVELTSLQGTMGRIYALKQGEDERVAQAIFEHYLPRYSGDALPHERIGLVVGLADRLDSILGLLAAGLEPSGSADPYALRRAASGLVQNLIHWKASLDLRQALQVTSRFLPLDAGEEVQARALAFISQRLRTYLQDQGIRYDVADAVLAERGHDPYLAAVAAAELQEYVARRDWPDLLNAYARCKRIVRDLQERFDVRRELMVEEATLALYEAYLGVADGARADGSASKLLESLSKLVPAINRFFDEVLVMTEDQQVRENRLGLVQRIASLADGIIDFSRLEGF